MKCNLENALLYLKNNGRGEVAKLLHYIFELAYKKIGGIQEGAEKVP